MSAARGTVSMAMGTASMLRTLATPILGPRKTNDNGELANSVMSLSTADGKVDYLAVADYISYSLNTGLSVAANTVLGYNLEFKVHEHGAILVTGAKGRVGAHCVRTLCALGYTVFAGVGSIEEGRRLQSRCKRDGSKGLCVPFILDVTSPDSLRDAYEFVCEHLGVAPEDPSQRAETLLQQGFSSRSLDSVPEDAEATSPSKPFDPLKSLSPKMAVHSATPMPRGHSRLAMMPPVNASDFEEEEDEELFVPSRATSPTAVAAASTAATILVGIVNCEGTESPGPMELLPLAELMRCYEINTAGAVASKGRIVNVCSSAGLTAAPINGSYAASKMALSAVSDSLRVELYPFGISVSIIEPGSLDANAWSPNQPLGSKLDNDKNHSYQLHQQKPMTPAPSSTPLPPQPSSPPNSNPLSPAPTSRRPSLVNIESPSSLARFHPVSPSSFPIGGLSIHPYSPDHVRPISPPEPISPPRKAPPPRSWSSLSSYGHNSQPLDREEYVTSPTSPTSPRASGHFRSASPSFIPVPRSFSRSSVGPTSATPSPSMIAYNRSANPNFGHTGSPRPMRAVSPPARRSLTPQPSSRPNQMYQPPTPSRAVAIAPGESDEERGRSVSRMHRHHPVWDASNRVEVSERLYGPLISTVRDLSEAAAASSRSEPNSTPSSPPQMKKLTSSASGSNTTLHSASSSSSKLNETTPLLNSMTSVSKSLTVSTSSVDNITSESTTPSSSARTAAQSSSRHTSRAIVHALTAPYPKTRYRVGWDARATAALRWALPDRVLDWGFNALSAVAAKERDEKEKEEKEKRSELAVTNT
ncbi:hypothetical protein BC829DRAFT_402399 [Chytridium lagenaria]|nr:hypothetical protein BC829DRAFT_402399 [Chytridium lagenaria]